MKTVLYEAPEMFIIEEEDDDVVTDVVDTSIYLNQGGDNGTGEDVELPGDDFWD